MRVIPTRLSDEIARCQVLGLGVPLPARDFKRYAMFRQFHPSRRSIALRGIPSPRI